MRVPIPHDLGKAEATRRLQSRSGDIGSLIPGGLAQVTTAWPDADHMNINVAAMGQAITAKVAVEDRQVVLTLDLPPALSFFRPLIERGIRDNGQKLLGPK